ncbi:NADP-dependent isocitrate dehydrogenase [Roseibium sp. RKSG952]|uniref:NADP-dependent isocitrate dehydrogenase n=1 Tax=Roseibium sp. RKSG952 TaxID=2529384 RepID=UPI0012BD5B18|nr:NADP-dependent isocitrate dehydrogenase [Roseibium sp. RKSG952]MTH97522.1 NADP-dependent isocitrate dehydrogenase [Roseibium sp. RKSG952]
MLIKNIQSPKFVECKVAQVIDLYDRPNSPTPVTIAPGDGIGPEIMEAAIRCLSASGARLAIQTVDIGKKMYEAGFRNGIHPDSWKTLRDTGVLLRAPVIYPEGGSFQTPNVSLRRYLDMFATVTWAKSRSPFVATNQPNMDLIIIQDSIEDLYTSIEHHQSGEVYQSLKLVSQPAMENIIRFAFKFAQANCRKKVTAFSKDTILPITDGLFHEIFDSVAKEYPDIESDHWDVSAGTAKVALAPVQFDVVVTTSMYGNIVSELATAMGTTRAHAASASYGEHFSMFSASHGAAPDIAGKGIANPSGLILAGINMLWHLNLNAAAENLHNAWLKTIEDGIHTADVYRPGISNEQVTTIEFADAVIERLGLTPEHLKPACHCGSKLTVSSAVFKSSPRAEKKLVGIDLFVEETHRDPVALANRILDLTVGFPLQLTAITNRGVLVWPCWCNESLKTDHWCCRFEFADQDKDTVFKTACTLMQILALDGLDIIKSENLYTFDGIPGYSQMDDKWYDDDFCKKPVKLQVVT